MSITRTSTLFTAFSFLVVTACAGHQPAPDASGTTASASKTSKCTMTSADSSMASAALGPVYLMCDVDRQAKQIGNGPRPTYTPPSGKSCVTAEVQFVVSPQGGVEQTTVKVTKTNDDEFANALIRELPGLRYEPALKNGAPVAQIASVEMKMASFTVRAGMASSRPPRRPSC